MVCFGFRFGLSSFKKWRAERKRIARERYRLWTWLDRYEEQYDATMALSSGPLPHGANIAIDSAVRNMGRATRLERGAHTPSTYLRLAVSDLKRAAQIITAG